MINECCGVWKRQSKVLRLSKTVICLVGSLLRLSQEAPKQESKRDALFFPLILSSEKKMKTVAFLFLEEMKPVLVCSKQAGTFGHASLRERLTSLVQSKRYSLSIPICLGEGISSVSTFTHQLAVQVEKAQEGSVG